MATRVALAMRREAALGRIEAALAALAARHGVTFDTALLRPSGRHDADMAHTLQLEGMATLTEQIVATTEPAALPETATPLVIDGVEPKHIAALAGQGITTLEQLRAADDDTLLSIPGIGPRALERIRAHLDANWSS